MRIEVFRFPFFPLISSPLFSPLKTSTQSFHLSPHHSTMKFSIALSAVAIAFIGAVSAAPAPGTYANCNSNPAYKNLNIPPGYAVITAYDNNAANVSKSVALFWILTN